MNIRSEVRKHNFLWIDDEASSHAGLAVHDRREGIGNNLGTWIDTFASLAFLVEHGAEAWCNSHFNGIGEPPRECLAPRGFYRVL